MSILTKVFVVLVNFLAVALVALVVAYVANSENYRTRYEAEKSLKEVAEAAAQRKENDRAAAVSQLGELKLQLDNAQKSAADVLRTVKGERDGALAEAATAKAKLAEQEASVRSLTAANNQTSDLLKAALAELESRRQQVVKAETRAIELGDRINELQNQVKGLENANRQKEERIVQLEEENKGLAAQVPQDGKAVAAAPQPAAPIKGQITQVRQVGGQTFAQINVGKVDKVQTSMRFMIYRDSKFLGNLVVVQVDDREAAGRVEYQQGPLNAGDRVHSGLAAGGAF